MSEEDFRSIRVERQDSVFSITLNTPPLNIMDFAMIEELRTALEKAEAIPEVQVIAFRGAGPRGFSAGVSVQDHTPDRVGRVLPSFDDLFRILAGTEKITLAAVRGFCLGGGFELAAMCDLVVAAETAQFAQPEIKLGQFAPVGAILLPFLVGYRKAAELLFTGSTMDARQAEGLGLVNRVVREDQLSDAVEELLRQITAQSHAILRLTKSFLRRASGLNFEALLQESERFYFEAVVPTEDSKEGIYAFLEKRPPRWSHV